LKETILIQAPLIFKKLLTKTLFTLNLIKILFKRL